MMQQLTREEAALTLWAVGAQRVSVVGRGRFMLAFFEYGGVARVWSLRPGASVENFRRDVERELGVKQQKAA